LDPPALQVAVRRLTERGLERADEVRLRHARDGGERRDVERRPVVEVDAVARPKQAPVLVLLGCSHRAGRYRPEPRRGTADRRLVHPPRLLVRDRVPLGARSRTRTGGAGGAGKRMGTQAREDAAMRGIVWTGSELVVTDRLEVRDPGPGEAQVRVEASGI